jgi:hypothetical protein
MKTCFACARQVDRADRFCGLCGADQAAAPALAKPREAARPRLSVDRRGYGATALMVLGAIAALGYTSFSRGGESRVLRLALDGIGVADSAGETGPPPAEPLPEPAARPEPAEAWPAATVLLQPGLWQFSIQLVAVSKADPADQFEISRQGIGASEAHTICVTPALAEDPGSTAFPFPPGLACSPAGFAMADGTYRSRLACNFPQFGGSRPVTASGRYSRSDITLDVDVPVPAQVVSGDFDRPPEIVMQYRIQGYLTGPC